jgi:hypothetical protein
VLLLQQGVTLVQGRTEWVFFGSGVSGSVAYTPRLHGVATPLLQWGQLGVHCMASGVDAAQHGWLNVICGVAWFGCVCAGLD